MLSDDPASAPAPGTISGGGTALVLTGGGARGAYQVGMLRYLARRFPELRIPILTGVSAGAVNAVHLAQHHGTFPQAVAELAALWLELAPERVFRADVRSLARNVGKWGFGLVAGAPNGSPQLRGLVETDPLREFLTETLCPVDGELTGIDFNLHRGTLRAVAISATSYTTARSVVWVQGREIETWERPQRHAVQTRLGVEHILASGALPLFFPAVQVGNEWYGDGGVRLTAPLSPAMHLGADRILAVSTRYARSSAEAERPEIVGYPPPAQILGVLYNAIFLDLIDQDVLRMDLLNTLLRDLPAERRKGMRVVDLLVIRPSQDLGMLAREYEPRLPRGFRFLTRRLGTRRTSSPDVLSLLMFQDDYLRRVMELGEQDAEARGDELAAFLGEPAG